MCGLFGWNYKKKAGLDLGKREFLSLALAIENSSRGNASWGIYHHTKKEGGMVRREVGDICEAGGLGMYGRLPLVMGHTRWPTKGRVDTKNCHPFRHGKILLSHNGTVSNSDELDQKYNRKVGVDSEHFAMHLDAGLPFSDIEGYGAITWIDTEKPERVYLCRMRGGSLSVAAVGTNNANKEEILPGVAWSSEESHLRDALRMAKLDYDFFRQPEEGRIYYAEAGQLFKTGEETQKLEVKERQWSYPGNYRGGGWWDAEDEEEERGYWTSRIAGTWVWVHKPGYKASDVKPGQFPYGGEYSD